MSYQYLIVLNRFLLGEKSLIRKLFQMNFIKYRLSFNTIIFASTLSLIILSIPSYAENNQRQNLLILGDSLSAGYRLGQDSSWPFLLNEKLTQLSEANSANDYPIIINGSISGDTAEQALSRLPDLLTQYKPRYVLIELGANNGLQGLDVLSLKSTLNDIINLIKENHAQPILMQIDIPRNYGKRYVDTFRQIYPALAEEQDITLIPFFMEDVVIQNAQNNGTWLQDDGIHPTDIAQPYIVDWMLEKLMPILQSKDK